MSENNDFQEVWAQVRSLEPDLECRRSQPRSAVASSANREEERGLRRLIETQVVPRLMLSHRGPETSRDANRAVVAEDVAELARIAVAHDATTARIFCEQLETEGVTTERLLVDLFAPAAKLLGELWSADRCTFADVTVGLSVIQRMMRERGVELIERPVGRERGRAVLAPVPGEQHTLGLQMVADFMRRDGWDVSHIPLATEGDILSALGSEWVDVLGLSVSNGRLFEATAQLIAQARETSLNPNVLVTVGGAGAEHKERALGAGAELHAATVEELIVYLRSRFVRAGDPVSS